MSHYKPYPAYKDSGVEWLGRVPEHWQIKRLKHIANVQTGVAKGKDNEGKDTIEVPYLRVANVQDGYLSLDDVTTIEIPREDLERYSLQPGDVLMNEGGDFDKLGRGSVWQGEIESCIHQNHVFAVRPTAVPSAWLNAFTGSLAAQFYFMGRAKQSTNLASISSSNIMELPVALPPEAEMDLLLDHIDHETARIDALVVKKTRFIELLREKRQALITHAVTKGLDPSVKMKDSGVEWLGEVPEHWEVKPLRRLLLRLEQGWSPNASSEPCEPGDWGVLKLSAIKQGCFFPEQNKSLLAETQPDQTLETQVGDLLLSRANTPQLVGDACVVRSLDGRRLMLSDLIYRLSLIEGADPEFFCNVLISGYGRSQIEADARGSSMTMAKISQEHILNWLVPVPPFGEQREISAAVETARQRLEASISKTERSITLLKERRAALITAAVTGQIDLREAV